MKSAKAESAKNDLANGYNCSQSIIRQYCEELNIPEELAVKVASGFGGGMRRGHTCGVISGSIMVLGLKFGAGNPDPETKEKLYKMVRSFTDDFMAVHNSTCCKELLGIDTGTDEGRNTASKLGLYKSLCPVFVETAVLLLDDKLKQGL
jgi:C_GCAxxG_C_C family probable redox protein